MESDDSAWESVDVEDMPGTCETADFVLVDLPPSGNIPITLFASEEGFDECDNLEMMDMTGKNVMTDDSGSDNLYFTASESFTESLVNSARNSTMNSRASTLSILPAVSPDDVVHVDTAGKLDYMDDSDIFTAESKTELPPIASVAIEILDEASSPPAINHLHPSITQIAHGLFPIGGSVADMSYNRTSLDIAAFKDFYSPAHLSSMETLVDISDDQDASDYICVTGMSTKLKSNMLWEAFHRLSVRDWMEDVAEVWATYAEMEEKRYVEVENRKVVEEITKDDEEWCILEAPEIWAAEPRVSSIITSISKPSDEVSIQAITLSNATIISPNSSTACKAVEPGQCINETAHLASAPCSLADLSACTDSIKSDADSVKVSSKAKDIRSSKVRTIEPNSSSEVDTKVQAKTGKVELSTPTFNAHPVASSHQIRSDTSSINALTKLMEERDKSISVPMTPKELERPRKFLPPSSAYTKCPTPLSASTALTDVSLSHDTTDGIISKLDVSITPIGRARNSALTTLFKSAPSSKSFASSNTPNCTTPIKPHFISNLPSRPRSPPTPAIKPQAFHVTAFNPTTTRSTIMSLLDIRKPTSKISSKSNATEIDAEMWDGFRFEDVGGSKELLLERTRNLMEERNRLKTRFGLNRMQTQRKVCRKTCINPIAETFDIRTCFYCEREYLHEVVFTPVDFSKKPNVPRRVSMWHGRGDFMDPGCCWTCLDREKEATEGSIWGKVKKGLFPGRKAEVDKVEGNVKGADKHRWWWWSSTRRA